MYRLTEFPITNKSANPNIGNFAVTIVDGELRVANVSRLNSYASVKPNYKIKNEAEVIGDFSLISSNGSNWRGWFGQGSQLIAEFDNSEITIRAEINVSINDFTLTYTCTNKINSSVEKEGLKFGGILGFFNRDNTVIEGDYLYAISGGVYSYSNERMSQRVKLDGIIQMIGDVDRVASESKEIVVKSFNYKSELAPVRLLNQPDGYDCGITISHHGHDNFIDNVNAVHFGISDETDPNYGTKGLSARGIKTTWSVYYESEAWAPGFDDPDQLAKNLELQSEGHEIIPHTTYTGSESRARVQGNLQPYEDNFNSRSWTDHGLASGVTSAGLASRGWDESDMDYYIVDLLESYGYDNAWSYEDILSLDRLNENIFGFPHFLLFKSKYLLKPVSGDPIWLWPSSNRPFSTKTLTAETLQTLIDECGSVDAHDYFTFDGNETDNVDGDGFYYDNGTNKVITNTLDDLLVEIKNKKDAGQVWNPTVGEWVDYNLQLKQLEITNHSASSFDVNNPATTISGCTFLIGKNQVVPKLNGVDMNYKSVQKGTICWADLPNGNHTITF